VDLDPPLSLPLSVPGKREADQADIDLGVGELEVGLRGGTFKEAQLPEEMTVTWSSNDLLDR
jgi:hypothetical protein